MLARNAVLHITANTDELMLSRFYFGSTKVVKKALGSSDSEEYQPGLAQVSGALKSTVGLLFTRLSKEEVRFCLVANCAHKVENSTE